MASWENTQLLDVGDTVVHDVEMTPAEYPENTPAIQGRGFKVASKIVLLLVVGTVCAIVYTSARPWATKTTGADLQSADLQSSVELDAVTASSFQPILNKAQAMHGKDRQPARASKTATSKKNQIREAVNEVSSATPVEQASAQGTVVTSKMLQQLNNLTDSPEHAPTRLANSITHTIVRGDMIIPKGQGRRLWSGNLWPDKSAIPYCFHPQIAASSKHAFLSAVDHIETLVPCMGFTLVSTTGQGCQGNGIFVTSENDGCWSYVGKIPASTVQQLNLMPNGCDYIGIAAHEILHALGMAHEQSRTDYNSHVIVYWGNIQPKYRNQYAIDPEGDVSLPYDIMSLMHYGDSDFAYPGLLTMKAIGSHRGVMGQRMGLSWYDATQLGLMYGCQAKKFALCTNSPTKCTEEDCGCHSNGGSTTIKTFSGWPTANCKRCEKQCPDAGTGRCLEVCGCGSGFTKKTLQMQGGGVCYACEVANGPTPSPPPAGPAPPPAHNCIFPTSPADCAQKDMPGCTVCDDPVGEPWCFVSSQGDWRYCTKEDDACEFPFEYNGKTYNTCTTDGNTGAAWCFKVGGGWKNCGQPDGFPGIAPAPNPGPAPTPPPPFVPSPTTSQQAWDWGGFSR